MLDVKKEMKTKIINFLISKGVDMINNNEEVRKTLRELMHGEDRTLLLKIKNFNTIGFGVIGDRLVKTDAFLLQKPTVTVTVSEDTFVMIIKANITLKEAFFYADCDVDGDDWVRDFLIFNTIFEEFKHLSKDLGI